MTAATATTRDLRVSKMAENLIGSEIIKLAGEIRERLSRGERIYNFTIGDFDPALFPIPKALEDGIVEAYHQHQTNYPPADGIAELRRAVCADIARYQGLAYNENEVLVAGGARPLIYAIFQAIVDPGDTVVFPVPSWNNNHYTHLAHAHQVFVETLPENNFMPDAASLRPHVADASLLALCSPLNPTGTVFSRAQLEDICDLVLEENNRRSAERKPLYLMYDQIYWQLTYGETTHTDPVSLRPEMREYTVFVDGISKSFAATGVRVGWSFGPKKVVDKMKSILGHVGAWSPKAEQVATARFLADEVAVQEFLMPFREKIFQRLRGFYAGLMALREQGYPVDAIAPQAAIYLTVRFDLKGLALPDGTPLETTEQITAYLLGEAQLALVPFSAFGASKTSTWYRLSVGTASDDDVQHALDALKGALSRLESAKN